MNTRRKWQESDAVLDVHGEKVIVDVKRLPATVRHAAAHAHDAEVPGR